MILRAPGTNCDDETAFAFERAGAARRDRPSQPLARSRRGSPTTTRSSASPAASATATTSAAGRIFANQLRHHLADSLAAFRDAGKLILGICNGFQVLIKSGLLDSDDAQGQGATLTWNASGRFIDRWVNLRIAGDRCVFLAGIERMYLPIAHAEGQFVGRDEATLDRLEHGGQLVLRYATPTATCAARRSTPTAPQRDVAGMCDARGRVFGLMPHPERFIDRTQHPQWTRMPPFDEGDGLQLFRNAVQYFA